MYNTPEPGIPCFFCQTTNVNLHPRLPIDQDDYETLLMSTLMEPPTGEKNRRPPSLKMNEQHTRWAYRSADAVMPPSPCYRIFRDSTFEELSQYSIPLRPKPGFQKNERANLMNSAMVYWRYTTSNIGRKICSSYGYSSSLATEHRRLTAIVRLKRGTVPRIVERVVLAKLTVGKSLGTTHGRLTH